LLVFTLEKFVKIRPFLFHLTARTNLSGICESLVLFSAANLMNQARDLQYLHIKRSEALRLRIEGKSVSVRDQRPLHKGNIEFESGWTIHRFIHELNERVFFWPGTHKGLNDYGLRHFKRYESEHPIILRVPTKDLIATNAGSGPQFCKFNSGSPRCSQGKRSPRGSQTFLVSEDAGFKPSEVVEVTFRDQIALPRTTVVSHSPLGPWSWI